jgi:hypothetical protein
MFIIDYWKRGVKAPGGTSGGKDGDECGVDGLGT